MAEREKLVLDELDVNDGETFEMEVLDFTPAQKKPLWVTNADSDGDVLVDEPHYTNAVFDLQIRVDPVEDTDTALEKVGELIEKLQNCARTTTGVPLEWTPNNATQTLTWYATLGELLEIPITVTGEFAGWFIESPVLKIRLTCRPFGYDEERIGAEEAEGEGPQQEIFVSGIKGDVSAEARLVVTDADEEPRRYLEWGKELVESEEGNPATLLEADEDFTVEGFQGELVEEEGSHSSKVIKIGLTPGRSTVAAATELSHAVSYYGKLRVKAEGAGALFRLIYRTADGEWSRLPWVEAPITEEWVELSMRELNFQAVRQGAQISEVRIEAKCESGTVEAFIDTLGLTPTSGGRGEGRGIMTGGTPLSEGPNSPGTVESIDNPFVGTEAWEVAWSNPSNAKVSDASYATVTLKPAEEKYFSKVLNPHNFGFAIPEGATILGIVTDIDMLASGNSFNLSAQVFLGETSGAQLLELGVPPAEIEVEFGSSSYLWGLSPTPSDINASDFEVQVYVHRGTSGNMTASVDSVLVTVYYTTEANTNIVCHQTRSAEIHHNGAERENSAGTAWAQMPLYRGANFYLDPQGDDEKLTRLLVKMRRNDSKVEADAGLTDKQKIEVLVRERYLAPR